MFIIFQDMSLLEPRGSVCLAEEKKELGPSVQGSAKMIPSESLESMDKCKISFQWYHWSKLMLSLSLTELRRYLFFSKKCSILVARASIWITIAMNANLLWKILRIIYLT